MKINKKRIGFAITGSFYILDNTIEEICKIIKQGGEIIPLISSFTYNAKINSSGNYIEKIEKITKRKIISSIIETEELISKEKTASCVAEIIPVLYIFCFCIVLISKPIYAESTTSTGSIINIKIIVRLCNFIRIPFLIF